MEFKTLTREDRNYPTKFRERLGAEAPEELRFAGPIRHLERFTVGVLSTDTIGGVELMAAHDLLFALRDFDINFIGSWHSVMETEIFRLGLFRAHLTLTLFSAKGLARETFESFLLDRFYPPMDEFPERTEYFRRAKDGELLILSMARPDLGRTLKAEVLKRNLAVAALSDALFVPFCRKESKTFRIVSRAKSLGIRMFTSEHPRNGVLKELGVQVHSRKSLAAALKEWGARTPEPQVSRSVESAGHAPKTESGHALQSELFPEPREKRKLGAS